MARALRAWAINRGGKNSVRNLRYGPRTRLVRGIYLQNILMHSCYSRSHKGGKNIEELLLCEGDQTLDFNALIN